MFRLVTSKNGEPLTAYDVSQTLPAGLYALAKDIEGYLNNGYRVMMEDTKKHKYIIVNPHETICVQLIYIEPTPSTVHLNLPVDPLEDTQPIEPIVLPDEVMQS